MVAACIRRFDRNVGLAAAAVLVVAAPLEGYAPEVYSVALVLLACLFAQDEFPISQTVFLPMAGAAAGLQALVKPTAGAVALIGLLIAVGTARGSWARRLGLGALGYLTGFVAFWLIAGQQLTDIAAWVHVTLDISAGYTEAMSAEGSNRSFEYLVMATLMAGIVAYAYRNVRHLPNVRASVLRLILLSAMFWVVLKEAFVRHDHHSTIAFYTVSLVGVAIVPRAARRLMLSVLLAGSVVMTAVTVLAPLSTIIDPGPSVKSFFTSFPTLVRSSTRERINDPAKSQARREYRLPDDFVRRIGDSGVHVDPNETSLVWTYGLNWHPVPVFQRNVAYTEYADSLNADALARDDGPAFVLRENVAATDGRNDLWDSPRYMLALACNFVQWKATSRWQLLERGLDRCSPPSLLKTVRAAPGASVTVPEPRVPGSIVVATIERERSVMSRLESLVFKSPAIVVSADGTSYRVTRGALSGPMIVRMPEDSVWSPAFGGGTAYKSLKTAAAATYEFREVEVSPPPDS
jgi:hypothetical protein